MTDLFFLIFIFVRKCLLPDDILQYWLVLQGSFIQVRNGSSILPKHGSAMTSSTRLFANRDQRHNPSENVSCLVRWKGSYTNCFVSVPLPQLGHYCFILSLYGSFADISHGEARREGMEWYWKGAVVVWPCEVLPVLCLAGWTVRMSL